MVDVFPLCHCTDNSPRPPFHGPPRFTTWCLCSAWLGQLPPPYMINRLHFPRLPKWPTSLMSFSKLSWVWNDQCQNGGDHLKWQKKQKDNLLPCLEEVEIRWWPDSDLRLLIGEEINAYFGVIIKYALSENLKVPCNIQVVSRFPYKALSQKHKYVLEGVFHPFCSLKLHEVS